MIKWRFENIKDIIKIKVLNIEEKIVVGRVKCIEK